MLACWTAFVIVVSTTEIAGSNADSRVMFFVTVEERVSYWIMVIYCSIRILVELVDVVYFMLGLLKRGWLSTAAPAAASASASASAGDLNQAPTQNQTLPSNQPPVSSNQSYAQDSRQHPLNSYNFIVVCLILLASRVHASMETPYIFALLFLFAVRMFVKIFGNTSDSFISQIILVGDSILLSAGLQAGVVPQFSLQGDADISILAFLFTSITFARGLTEIQR
jgi:hypothetical protein